MNNIIKKARITFVVVLIITVLTGCNRPSTQEIKAVINGRAAMYSLEDLLSL